MYNYVIKRIFLSYTATYSHIYYWCLDPKQVNKLKHVIFYEVTNDLENKFSNVRQVIFVSDLTLIDYSEYTLTILPPPIEAHDTILLSIQDIYVNLLMKIIPLG